MRGINGRIEMGKNICIDSGNDPFHGILFRVQQVGFVILLKIFNQPPASKFRFENRSVSSVFLCPGYMARPVLQARGTPCK